MNWNRNVFLAPLDRDVLIWTNKGRAVVAKYIQPMMNVGIPGHWPLLEGEFPVAWTEINEPEGV